MARSADAKPADVSNSQSGGGRRLKPGGNLERLFKSFLLNPFFNSTHPILPGDGLSNQNWPSVLQKLVSFQRPWHGSAFSAEEGYKSTLKEQGRQVMAAVGHVKQRLQWPECAWHPMGPHFTWCLHSAGVRYAFILNNSTSSVTLTKASSPPPTSSSTDSL